MCYLIYPSTTEYGGDVLFVYLIDGERGADRVGNLFGPFPGGIWFSPGLSEHKAICFQKAPGSPHSVSSIFWEGSRKTLEKNCDNFIGWPHSFFKKMCVMCLCVKNRQDLCPGAIPVSGSRDESALVSPVSGTPSQADPQRGSIYHHTRKSPGAKCTVFSTSFSISCMLQKSTKARNNREFSVRKENLCLLRISRVILRPALFDSHLMR